MVSKFLVASAMALSCGCAPTTRHLAVHDYPAGATVEDRGTGAELPPIDYSYTLALRALHIRPISAVAATDDSTIYRIIVDHVVDVHNMIMWDGPGWSNRREPIVAVEVISRRGRAALQLTIGTSSCTPLVDNPADPVIKEQSTIRRSLDLRAWSDIDGCWEARAHVRSIQARPESQSLAAAGAEFRILVETAGRGYYHAVEVNSAWSEPPDSDQGMAVHECATLMLDAAGVTLPAWFDASQR
jgi:hypothetical protein